MSDLVFVDSEYRICGWLVGMDEEMIAEYRKKYNVWTYGHFVRFWKERGIVIGNDEV